MTIKILFYSLFCFLILSTLSTNSFSQSKKLKEPLPVYKPVTSNGNELDIYKQRQDEEKAEKEKWAQYNILKDGNESYRILLNNAMKFSFPIVTIFALIIAMTSRQSKESKKSIGYEGIAISSFALVVLFVFHLFMNSNNNLDLALEYTWKLGLIIIILSLVFLLLWTKIINAKDILDSTQKIITIICSLVSTGSIAYFLTNNIDIEHFSSEWNNGKSPFTAYPWNIFSFTFINGYLAYSLFKKNENHLST